MIFQNYFSLSETLNRSCFLPANQCISAGRLLICLMLSLVFTLTSAIGGAYSFHDEDFSARSTTTKHLVSTSKANADLDTASASPAKISAGPFDESFLWALTPEDQFSVELNQKVTTVTSIDRRDVTTENEVQLRQVWRVLEPDADGNFRIRQTIESIRLRVGNPRFPGQAFVIDSQSDQRPHRDAVELNRHVKEIVGVSFLVVMRPTGEVVTANLEAESQTKLENITADHPLKSLLSEQGMTATLSGVTNISSPQSDNSQSRDGQSNDSQSTWFVKDEIENSFGSFTRQRNYQIKKTETIGDRQLVTIEIESAISPKQIKFDGSALLDSIAETGEIEYDSTGGIFTRSKMQQSINSRLQYAGELLNMRLDSEIEIKIRKQD